MVKFNEDEDLGKVIAKKQLFSFGAAPLTGLKELVFAAGGNKFSSLCGFRFESKAETEYKQFFVAFVCKLRSKIYRQASANLSEWFIFKKISGKEMHCLSKDDAKNQYGFDIKKFFDSDYFQQSLVKFKSTIDKGLKTHVPDYVKKHGMEKAKDQLTSYDGQNEALVKDVVGRYTKAIEESLNFIDSHACNDKFYKLIDYDIAVEKEVNEDDIVAEASKWECEVEKTEEDGKEVWKVFEKDRHHWVATFQDEPTADAFSKEFPKMKEKYLKQALEAEAKKEMVEKEDQSKEQVAEKELFEDEETEKYDPPYTLAQIKEKYPKEVYDKLSKCPIHKWRAESGIELIHKEPDRKELERIWKNWNLMSQEMKDKSDKKSLELFGKTNAEHYKELIDSEQVDEGAVQNVLLAALLAVPGILPAKTVQQTIDRNKTYQATMNELNSPKKVRMVGEYTALQAANIIARTLYAEARNDGKDKGFMPVASVIYNRANGNKEDFAKACLKPLQFSCWNKMTNVEKDPKNFKVKLPKTAADNAKNQKLWQQAMEIAANMLADAFKPVTNANSYYATSMKKAPSWGKDLSKIEIIGSHKFGYLKNHTKFI